jgi:hypothetical protein
MNDTAQVPSVTLESLFSERRRLQRREEEILDRMDAPGFRRSSPADVSAAAAELMDVQSRLAEVQAALDVDEQARLSARHEPIARAA